MTELQTEQLELLITRQIDGRLTGEEQLELDEMIAADPAAAALADELLADHKQLVSAVKHVGATAMRGADDELPPTAPPVSPPAALGHPAAGSRAGLWRGLQLAAMVALIAGGTFFALLATTRAPQTDAPQPQLAGGPAMGQVAPMLDPADAHSLTATVADPQRSHAIEVSPPTTPRGTPAPSRFIGIEHGDDVYIVPVDQPKLYAF